MTERVVVVTGGMGGIGTAVCKRLAQAGHRVAANCLPGYPRKDEWLAGMRSAGFEAVIGVEADVTDLDACKGMGEAIRTRLGPVDILVNCAGITRDATFRKMGLDEWLAVINSNLNATYNVTKQFIDGMTSRHFGRVINISSVNGQKGQFGQTNYSAAKAGMIGFTRSLARELADQGITVNTVSPGYVNTKMAMAVPEDVRNGIIAKIPVGRFAEPSEIAHAVAFLASDDSGYITGSDLSINGGLFMM